MLLRAKCSAGGRAIVYLRRIADEGPVQCLLSNGKPAGLQYAGILSDEHAAALRIQTATTSDELVEILREIGSANYNYEPLPEPRTLRAKRIDVKCTDTVYQNTFYVYRVGNSDSVHCKSATSGSLAELECAGILSDAQGAAFALEAARTSDELATLLYQLGSKRFEYEPQ
jgi:hypothetical protein